MGSIMIRQAQMVTMNEREEVFIGDLLIENNKIVKMAPRLDDHADQEIDGRGKTLLPGFIQTHIHLCQTLFRGRADDMELMDWLRKRIWPLEAAHDEESIFYSALLGIGELISSGTTTICDMETVHHTDSAFQAMAQSGLRVISGKVMMDHGTDVPEPLQEDTDESLQKSVDLLEKWNGFGGGRIQYAFCPRFVVSCTERLLTEVRDLSAQYHVKVHTHASENRGEISLVEQERGMRNIVYLDHIGLANPRLILAHCVWLSEEEKQILYKRGVKVTHCPGSNLKLSSGIAEIPDLMNRHIHVGLGADGAPCNNNLDMFQEMRLAALIQKVPHGPTVMDARTVLRMATMGGAEVLGMAKEIGSLEVGKKADVVLLDLEDYHTFPSYDVDVYSRVVYSATRSNVDTVIIDGSVVLENRRVKTIDRSIVLRESDRSIKRLMTRM
ncbi:5-methylthioadenosine/S-adenosylhomocysteine deaminase [Paenibacillus sp. SORGH_AS306]|uniref:5'-deoxyadenosine deaminase n=1 Tax=Paenibacillus kyungheensis TaxID=1452732 RepID=A0AAX3M5M5_9BACL|nr:MULTISPECIES: 5'-deoxyadenosine deaminase [Paenibacillus]MDQ1233587.1 5-methylthioadenosine/S-adenosylhomocysteine deaminase [Paenibacillus sp. SORGH_AS_0306]MDR6110629.1 5-methylthioadenosine/S-adenosylhomocysteine deaminase [Paenibacillus sp. SORGH_AS_0338]WCT57514.1 5'-deoxyadenosine deaminase [Paenibacillus kyungheensis]